MWKKPRPDRKPRGESFQYFTLRWAKGVPIKAYHVKIWFYVHDQIILTGSLYLEFGISITVMLIAYHSHLSLVEFSCMRRGLNKIPNNLHKSWKLGVTID